ncbi:MAG: Shedu anti-phage system protein SduA domain-containing protein [Candidatus Paceibacterota bacterium]
MGKPTKTVEEKLKTRLSKIKEESRFSVTSKTVSIDRVKLFGYSPAKISYTQNRYFPSKKDDLTEEDFRVTILLNHSTLRIIGSALWNPPRGARIVLDLFRRLGENIDHILIGTDTNKIDGKNLHITLELYKTLLSINKEEGAEKIVRVQNRAAPFLESKYQLEVEDYSSDRDYSLLLEELLASKSLTQADILKLTDELESGENNRVVIEKQINKQAEWLLNAMQEIVDTEKLTTPVAKNLGLKFFGFPKVKTGGPEDLMEKILTEYGKNIIFGVPYLLNTNKYVVSKNGLSKSQFDLVLINLLSDIELVELKRPDEYVLDYNSSRGKFYASKDLSMAIAQAERYVSAILRDNDSEYSIEGKTIRKFIESEVGGTITLSVCRPTALVVMGRIQSLVKLYEELSKETKKKVTKRQYDKNAEQAYQELKGSYRNIQITTYSELIETARLRLQQA